MRPAISAAAGIVVSSLGDAVERLNCLKLSSDAEIECATVERRPDVGDRITTRTSDLANEWVVVRLPHVREIDRVQEDGDPTKRIVPSAFLHQCLQIGTWVVRYAPKALSFGMASGRSIQFADD